jgi:predicted membrane GTPase involved in stress response
MPQTRFVLQKAIDLGLNPGVSIKLIKKTVLLKKFMKSFDLMFELVLKNGIGFPNSLWFCKKTMDV